MKKIGNFLFLSLVMFWMSVNSALAQEITAINFNGDLIGKVIPDGTVISFDNEIIGNVTADSFIINGKGELIGGVIPQGVVIGNDNKLLGKVNNDGSVRLPSGKIIGKVLPNALVVDDAYNVLGAVVYPGLVYNDSGQTTGRLTGDGSYISMEGQQVGFVSPLGYAYRHSGNGFVLDGRLISSKMIVSPDGQFIGSLAPGGRVTNFNSQVIGTIHANGYAYDEKNKIIGKVVTNGYAFDNTGNYLGLLTYNGEVIRNGDVVGKVRADNKIVDLQNQVIGFKLDIAATAADLQGKYLGRLVPDGQIFQGRDAVGKVGARGFVFNADGEIIGQIIQAGPVFDYMGNLAALSLRNGVAVSVTGSPLGYVKDNKAYDNIGRLLGAVGQSVLVYDNNNTFLGLSGLGADLNYKGQKLKVSPFGYVYTVDNILFGRTAELAALYGEDGKILGYTGVNGELQNIAAENNYQMTQSGFAVAENNKITAASINPQFAVAADGQNSGYLSENNLLLDKNQKVTAKIVPEYKIVASTDKVGNTAMPVIGSAGKAVLAIGINGNMIGYADFNGTVRDYSGNVMGSVHDGDVVTGVKGAVLGKISGLQSVINDECSFLGMVSPKGEVRNTRDVLLGKFLTNNQAISEIGNVIGFGVNQGILTDFDGQAVGMVNTLGRVLNYARENLGCIRWDGRLYHENALIAKTVNPASVMNFENMIIGRININGEVINDKSQVVGYVRPDDSVVRTDGEVLGAAFRYQVAFDNDNSFLGRVLENGNVVSDKNDILGQVLFDGSVVSDNKLIGYALYDFYIYDEEGKTIGYLTRDGLVANFSGGKLGKADRGFLVSKDYELIGRGQRDYFIRNDENQVIGELMLNGDVINHEGSVIGKISGSGEVRDDKGALLGTATAWQYYNVNKPEPVKPADWANTPQKPIQVDAVPTPQPAEKSEFGLKTIGIALTPDGNYLGDILFNNDVVDKLGNLLGKKMPDGLVIDSSGSLIGIEEVKTPAGNQMFVPAGTFGSGGAYGTGTAPVNLGPGGGFGPGERYDPSRAAALAAAQSARRQEITVGKLSTNVDKKGFDGKQDYWDGVPRQLSTWRVDMSEMILADKPIPAVLARTIMSSNGADDVPVTAIVERNVYAEEGRNIVIPAGSRVMGTSSGGSGGGTSGGAVRVSITWTRLIRPDGSAFEFSAAKTGDAQGRGGALGYLDEQLLKKYTLPMVTNLLSSAVAYVAATTESGQGTGENSVETSKQQAANDARENFLDNMDQMFDQILQDKTDIAAVTYVPAGTRLIIYPKEDLWIRTIQRSKEESEQDIGKPTVFLDDKNPTGNAATGGNNAARADGTGTSAGTSGVVYQDEDVDVQANSMPLIDDSRSKKKRTPQKGIPPVTTTGATPPPPSYNANGLPPSTNAGGTNASAQLF